MTAPAGLHVRHNKIEGIGPWLWPQTDFWGWRHPKGEFCELRDLILREARPPGPRHIVQAGGCCGMYPRLFAEVFERVTTFEPEPVNFYCLVANCPSERIVKLQAALSDVPRLVSIENPWRSFNVGSGAIGEAPGQIPALRLDDFGFDCLAAIQLDCEGHEAAIIAGALKTIERHRPVIAIETPTRELCATLAEYGYREVGRCGTMPDVVFAA